MRRSRRTPPVCHDEFGGPQAANIPVKPFLSNPTSCGAFTASMEADSWEEPGRHSSKATRREVGPIGECERVPFEPSIEVQPDDALRGIADGAGRFAGRAAERGKTRIRSRPRTSRTRRSRCPKGSRRTRRWRRVWARARRRSTNRKRPPRRRARAVPPESKIGSIEIETPLLAEKIPGAIYIATPYDNPFGEPATPAGRCSRCMSSRRTRTRDLVKVAGKIEPNPVTGQLVTTFLNNPAAAVQPLHAEVPSRRDRAAGQPADVRHLHDAGRVDAVVGAAENRSCCRAPSRSRRASAKGLPLGWRAAVQTAGDLRHRRTTAAAPTARSTCGSSAKTANRRSRASPRPSPRV